MKRTTAVVLIQYPHLATAGMGSALDSLFGSATGRGEESFRWQRKRPSLIKTRHAAGIVCQ